MSYPLVDVIEILCIYPVELSHAFRKVPIWSFDKKMVVVVHQTVCVAEPVIPFVSFDQEIEEGSSILVVQEYGFLFVATRSDMVNRTTIFDP